jgi:hypothetical protein
VARFSVHAKGVITKGNSANGGGIRTAVTKLNMHVWIGSLSCRGSDNGIDSREWRRDTNCNCKAQRARSMNENASVGRSSVHAKGVIM